MERRTHPILVYFPTILVFVIAFAVGAYIVVSELNEDGPPPDSTYSEFGARYLAKSAYSRMDNTVGLAVCDAIGYRNDDDTWEIECRLDRDDFREVTHWEVTPDGEATLKETRFEEL